MADTLDLLTLNEGKTAINLATTVTTHDTELAMFITGVSRRIDAIIGPVVRRSVTERYDGGGSCIELRTTPVASVTSVVEWDTAAGTSTSLTAETDSVKPADAFLVVNRYKHSVSVLRRSSGGNTRYRRGVDNVAVVYSAGRYADTASVDAMFKLAAANILRRVWQREAKTWAQNPTGFASPEGVDVGFFKVVDPMVVEWFPAELPNSLFVS